MESSKDRAPCCPQALTRVSEGVDRKQQAVAVVVAASWAPRELCTEGQNHTEPALLG